MQFSLAISYTMKLEKNTLKINGFFRRKISKKK
jgi:hypothetical protein